MRMGRSVARRGHGGVPPRLRASNASANTTAMAHAGTVMNATPNHMTPETNRTP